MLREMTMPKHVAPTDTTPAEDATLRSVYPGAQMVRIKASPDGKYLYGSSDCLSRFRINKDGSLTFEERSPLYLSSVLTKSIWISDDSSHICALDSSPVGARRMKQLFGSGQLEFVAPEDTYVTCARYLTKTQQWILASGNPFGGHGITLKDIDSPPAPATATASSALKPSAEPKSLVVEKWNEGIFEFTEISLAGVPVTKPGRSNRRSARTPKITKEEDGSIGRMIMPVWSEDLILSLFRSRDRRLACHLHASSSGRLDTLTS